MGNRRSAECDVIFLCWCVLMKSWNRRSWRESAERLQERFEGISQSKLDWFQLRIRDWRLFKSLESLNMRLQNFSFWPFIFVMKFKLPEYFVRTIFHRFLLLSANLRRFIYCKSIKTIVPTDSDRAYSRRTLGLVCRRRPWEFPQTSHLITVPSLRQSFVCDFSALFPLLETRRWSWSG